MAAEELDEDDDDDDDGEIDGGMADSVAAVGCFASIDDPATDDTGDTPAEALYDERAARSAFASVAAAVTRFNS